MKNKLLWFLPLFTMLLWTASSCSEDSNENVEPTSPSIHIEEENTHPVLPQEGGTISIAFTSSGNWTASLMNDRAAN